MVYSFKSFRDEKEIVVLPSLKASHLSVILKGFYESPKVKNWMCELCTFSQIQSQLLCYCIIVALWLFRYYCTQLSLQQHDGNQSVRASPKAIYPHSIRMCVWFCTQLYMQLVVYFIVMLFPKVVGNSYVTTVKCVS